MTWKELETKVLREKWDGSVFPRIFVGLWSRSALIVSLYAFPSWIGMWNRLVTPPINGREGMEGGGEGTSSKEGNGEKEWLSTVDMTDDGGVAVGL